MADNESKQRAIIMRQDLWDALDAEAERLGMSRGALVRRACMRAVGMLGDDGEEVVRRPAEIVEE